MACEWMKYFVTILFIFVVCSSLFSGVIGISCYVCSSKNGSDTNCEDPYHPAYSKFAKACEVPKEHHIGTFPANFCVKIIGKSANTKESLVIRTCVLENMDSQCGVFKFGGEQLNGCILTCDVDGCNTSSRLTIPNITISLISLISAKFFIYSEVTNIFW